MRTATARRGFTLVDLIVCIVIAVIGLSLLLPAIMKARQQARTQSVEFSLWQTETNITLVKEEIQRLEGIKLEIANPASSIAQALAAEGKTEETLTKIARDLTALRAELQRLRTELARLKQMKLDGAPFAHR